MRNVLIFAAMLTSLFIVSCNNGGVKDKKSCVDSCVVKDTTICDTSKTIADTTKKIEVKK
jgi:hypothetical protein